MNFENALFRMRRSRKWQEKLKFSHRSPLLHRYTEPYLLAYGSLVSIIKLVGVLHVKLSCIRWKDKEFYPLYGSVLSNLFLSLLFQKLAEDRSVSKNVKKSRKLTYQKSLRRVRIVFCVNPYVLKRLYHLILLCFGQKWTKYLIKCLCSNTKLLLKHW